MPCTFCHSIAVVPLRRIAHRPLGFTALVIGSMSPDFGCYLHLFALADFAHSPLGTIACCLPAGLLALVLFAPLRRPLCELLPQPHRAALLPLATRPAAPTFRSMVAVAFCIICGAWTHVIWDSFTHPTGWAVQHSAFLHRSWWPSAPSALPVSYLLQQASTVLGGFGLAALYMRWLRHKTRVLTTQPNDSPDAWRYWLLGILCLIAAAIALPCALRTAFPFSGYTAVRVFIFRAGVNFSALFASMYIVASLAVHHLRRSRIPAAIPNHHS